MSFPETIGSDAALDPPLVVLTLLADPVSTLLARGRLMTAAAIALRSTERVSRQELTSLRDLWLDLGQLQMCLKQAFTDAYAAGDIDAASTQRLVDRFELWGA
jgi:hypothetical protein